jgi:DNA-directed RNA polymerase subunit M/transcription elongation factor TFIIS
MKFCTECQNMYYISIDENNSNNLTYYCRFCGHKDLQITEGGIVVLKTQFKKNEQKFNYMINKYTKYDPTLPRNTNMKCPNDCASESASSAASAAASSDPSEIIYLRYDNENMKYLYICSKCNFTWKTDDKK